MININQENIRLSVESMVRQLSNAYISIILSDVPLKSFPSVMIWGPPGVGKSDGIRQIGKEIEAKTSKRVIITDVRLLLFNPVDLRGILTANEDKTLAVWLKPKIFQMDESPDVINILFLDEISAAPQSVQAAAYQITLDRTVGEHRLPDNCIVIAAGNRVTDRSVAYTMPKALANRLCHIEIECDIKSWRSWAIESGIHPIVLGYLEYNPSMLMGFNTTEEGNAFATPRSWEMVSNIFNYVSEDINEVYPLIAGCIGHSSAFELLSWAEVYNKIPDVEDIFSGTATEIPLRPESLVALTSKVFVHALKNHSEREISNLIEYASGLPVEFKDKIFSDLLKIKSIHKLLSKNRVYDDWFARSGRDWIDYEL